MRARLPLFLVAASLAVLAGCSAIPVDTTAANVELVKERQPGCLFVGDVTAGQGNGFTTMVTTDKNLIEGSRNALRNSAAEMGANLVVVDTQVQSSRGALAGGVHSSVYAGSAWLCMGRPAHAVQAPR